MHVKEKAKCCWLLEFVQMLTNICEFNSDRFLIWEFFIYVFTCQTNSTSLSITSESKKPYYSPSYLSSMNKVKEVVIAHLINS